LDSVDGPEFDDGRDGDGEPDDDDYLHGDRYGCERLPGYGDGDGDGGPSADDHVDGDVEWV
jgi:hypothetical protein